MARPLGIGFIGHGWMGRAHAFALATLQRVAPPSRPLRLVALAGRDPGRAGAAARALGFEWATDDWRRVVEDLEVDVVAVLAPPDAHPDPCSAALEAGKPVLCEKPLAPAAPAARNMAAAAARAGVPAVCGFNYRFVPALRLAREVIASGKLGAVRHFRAAYLQDWAAAPSTPGSWRLTGGEGCGAVGDYCHLVDLCRYLCGEPVEAIARTAVLIGSRPDPGDRWRSLPVNSEDWYAAVLRLDSGATATLEASRLAVGRKGHQVVEVYGTTGALWWDLEDLNRLHVFVAEDEAAGLGGFRDILVTEPGHPFMRMWWAPGHILGWDHTFVHQWREFLAAVIEGQPSPHQASFDDGYRAAAVCDAILEAAARGSPVEVPVDA